MIALVTGASSGIGEATARLLRRDHAATLILVARREDRLRALADELGDASVVAVDLVDDDAPERIRAVVEAEHGGRLDLLVNNAGAAWRGTFEETGWENVQRHMALNFDAQVRVTEALLPALRASAPSAIVNVGSTAGRIARGGSGSYSAAKFALGGWTDALHLEEQPHGVHVGSTAGRVARGNSGSYSAAKFALGGWTDALHLEEQPHGVHVGLVLPGFAATEGFPQRELVEKRTTRWLVSTPEKVAEAVLDAGLNGKAERYVPRAYWVPAVLRVLTPRLVRRALGGGGSLITPSTTATKG